MKFEATNCGKDKACYERFELTTRLRTPGFKSRISACRVLNFTNLLLGPPIKQGLTQSNKDSPNQTRTHSIKQGLTQSNKDSPNQTRTHPIKQGLTQSNKDSPNQTRTHSIKQGLTQSNKDSLNQTRTHSIKQGSN